MQVQFRTRRLARCYADVAIATRTWGHPVGERYIRAVSLWEEVGSWGEAERYRPWRLHALRGDRRGQWACELGSRTRLIVSRDEEISDLVWIEEVSAHYGD